MILGVWGQIFFGINTIWHISGSLLTSDIQLFMLIHTIYSCPDFVVGGGGLAADWGRRWAPLEVDWEYEWQTCGSAGLWVAWLTALREACLPWLLRPFEAAAKTGLRLFLGGSTFNTRSRFLFRKTDWGWWWGLGLVNYRSTTTASSWAVADDGVEATVASGVSSVPVQESQSYD